MVDVREAEAVDVPFQVGPVGRARPVLPVRRGSPGRPVRMQMAQLVSFVPGRRPSPIG
ncbi:hypothetical protein ACFQV8_19375 [Pseudonocardia benzenivorans]